MSIDRFSYDNLWHIYSRDIPGFISRLAETPPMLRLKEIGMNCGCEYVALHQGDMCRRYTRFEHSVGVGLIVWHFTHDTKQTIAGLFHDIATPAFAHVVDFLNGDHLTQESTEGRTAGIIENSPEIQAILNEWHLTTADVCNYHLYPIADNASPRLSADRLEYTFGNFIQYGVCGTEDIECFFRALTCGVNEQNEPELIFHDPEIAEQFALRSMTNSYIYVSDPDRYTMQYLAELLKAAMKEDILTPDDLYATEKTVIEKLNASPSFTGYWRDYCGIKAVRRTASPVPDAFCFKIDAKRRYLDPYVKDIGRVTDFSEHYREEVRTFLHVSFEDWLSEARSL